MPMTNTNQHDDYERGTPPGKSCSVGSKLINMEPLGDMQFVNLSTCPLLKSRFQVVEISSFPGRNMSIIRIVDKIPLLSIVVDTNQSTNIGNR